MNKTETIYYAGQGYIYRCPECDKVDRMSWDSVKKGDTANCRFCNEEFELDPKSNMTPELYRVIQEINTLETGTSFGASLDMLKKDNLVRAGESVGIDVLGGNKKEDDYFAPWRINKKQLAKLLETDEGKEIFEEVKKIMMDPKGFMENDDAKLVKELWEEGRLMVIIKKNNGLTKDQKLALLKEEGFRGYIDDSGKVTVFFGSTYAPECDSWVHWE